MARSSIIGFNRALSSGMGSTSIKQLMVSVTSSQWKRLTNIQASVNSDSSPVDLTNRIARLLVCTGDLPLIDSSITILDLNPFNSSILIKGYGIVLIDRCFQNEINLDFNYPIEIPPQDNLNIILGLSWADNDTLLLPSASVGYLSVGGGEFDTPMSGGFPYKLR